MGTTTDIVRTAAYQGSFEVPYLWLIALFPFLGAAINGIVGKKLQDRFGKAANHTIAVGAMGLSFAVAVVGFLKLLSLPAGARVLRTDLFPMFEVGDFRVHFSFAMDQLSGTMTLIITGIGAMIHVYSVGYMHGEKAYWRFFCYLNLFVFSMLLLVLGDTFLLMFFGWEGVGLCSYLLIGFWYQDFAKATAGMKAFVVNRIGDFAFICGLFLLFWSVGTAAEGVRADRADATGRYAQVTRLDPSTEALAPTADTGEIRLGATVSFAELQQQLAYTETTADGKTAKPIADRLMDMELAGMPVLFVVCLFFFIGACGKSAQIPLYVWLPDAMAGPTPVSALIHAATMVTAGVYMIARLNFLYFLSPGAMSIVAFTGACTALFAATMGLFQYDIKKVLAYSTVSQLGFMFIGVGVGAWWIGVFHLLTHACFKACLFLGSGSVIHGMHFLEHHGHDEHGDGHGHGPKPHPALRAAPDPRDPQDMRNMGGLATLMPGTRLTYMIACLAIAGFPIANGFYSKDEILWKAMSNGSTLIPGWLIWGIGFIAAGCTAFYMYRSYYMTFEGRAPSEAMKQHVHESPRSMTWVLWGLAGLCFLTILLGLPHMLGFHPKFESWLAPVMASGPFREVGGWASAHSLEIALALASIGIAFAGWGLARYFYKDEAKARERIARLRVRYDGAHELLYNKYWVDELYQRTFVRGFQGLARAMAWFDAHIIDWAVNFTGAMGRGCAWLGGFIDRMFVDGAVNGLARGIVAVGREGRRIQTGRINNYAWGIAVGVLVLAVIGRFAM
jgi:NADH-quinone oxidoreductase subunit L